MYHTENGSLATIAESLFFEKHKIYITDEDADVFEYILL